MKHTRMALAAALATPVLVLLAPTPALACTCGTPEIARLVEAAEVVATGEVVSIEPSGSVGAVGAELTYTVDLGLVLAGEPDNPLIFSGASDGPACGLQDVRVGADYVFFVDRTAGRLTANVCGGTGPVTDSLLAEVEDVTGPGQAAPAADPAVVEEPAEEPPAAGEVDVEGEGEE